jgi:hypothetical protein
MKRCHAFEGCGAIHRMTKPSHPFFSLERRGGKGRCGKGVPITIELSLVLIALTIPDWRISCEPLLPPRHAAREPLPPAGYHAEQLSLPLFRVLIGP